MLNNFFIISGPSGVGKTTLGRALVKRVDNLMLSISCTTRPMREGEKEGIDYFFLTEEEFMRRVKNNEFLEFSRVYGHLYGMLRSIRDEERDILAILDPAGAKYMSHLFLKAASIFILPPSRALLEKRLKERGHSVRSDNSIMNDLLIFDYLLINDDLEKTLSIMESIIVATRHSRYQQYWKHLEIIDEWRT